MSIVSDSSNFKNSGDDGHSTHGHENRQAGALRMVIAANLSGTKGIWSKLQRVFFVLLAPTLFSVVYVAHFRGAAIPTGFLTGDMPYYSANGRAIFERGNGFAGPNPYDPDPDAPCIYFHWLTWILGFGTSVLEIDPGIFYCGVGLVGSVALSWLTLCLVEELLPDRRFRYSLFLLVMWGGGALCLGQIGNNFLKGRPTFYDLFAYDPFGGWWFLNWGRNVLFPTESVYHAIVAATWLAVVRDRRLLVFGGVTLLATTHPWSGLQLMLMVGSWYGWLALRTMSRSNILMVFSLASALAIFLAYYFLFLPSFEKHRALQNEWTLSWLLPASSMALAYGPIGFFAIARIVVDKFRLPDSAWFFGNCFLVSFFLAKHEWFTTPHQPLHFTRGYVWMPLCLLALPFIQKGLVWCQNRVPAVLFWPLFVAAGGLASSDNALFVHGWWKLGTIGYSLTCHQRSMFAEIDRRRLDGVLLCPDWELSYLSATYTRVRPYYGHLANTPNFADRVANVKAWQNAAIQSEWVEGIDHILLRNQELPTNLDQEIWEVEIENAEYTLYSRKSLARKK